MKDKLTEISDDLNHDTITEKEARNLLLNLLSVGVTLPSYDETNAEIVDGLGLIKTLKNSPFKNVTADDAYKIGFANCYNWLNEKLGN